LSPKILRGQDRPSADPASTIRFRPTSEKEGVSVTHVILGDLSVSSLNMGLLILRVAVGIVFLAHGLNHIYGGGKIAGTARWFESLGMKPGILHAWMASLVEVAAGAALVLGLFTPIAAAGVVGVMLVAFITNHMKNGFFIFRPGEGYEYVMTLTLVAIAIGTVGPGQWSIDGHIGALQDLWGWPGFGIAAGAGGLGAAALLGAYWRPEKPAADNS
jgi:putative oxidoreductase